MKFLRANILSFLAIFMLGLNTGQLDAEDAPSVRQVMVPCLIGNVAVSRDEWGIPFIQADTDHDLFAAYGYITAKDRLWQMDGSRRLALGRVAEVAGRDQLNWDVHHRTLGLERAAEQSVALLDPETLDLIQAYTDGVNAYITECGPSLPFEFVLMGYTPEPWTIVDSLVITGLVSAWLAADQFDEEMYGELIEILGEEQASAIFPPVPPRSLAGNLISSETIHGGTPVSRLTSSRNIDNSDWSRIERCTPDIKQELILKWFEPLAKISGEGHLEASNVWAVDGSLTESGEPILAMDPHLNYFTPSILYEVRIQGGSFNCWGATFPGMPFLPFGANPDLAWGASNLPADTQDLFVLELNPEDNSQYKIDDGWENFEIINESISYKTSDGTLEILNQPVYISRFGPVITTDYGTYTALKWTGDDPSDDVTAFATAMRAGTLEEFSEAFRNYHSPVQNLCIAENGKDGRVGQLIAGDIPIRRGFNGRSPVKVTDSSVDWTGYIPFNDLPHHMDPPSGIVAHANNLPDLPPDYPYFLGASFTSEFRVERIRELIAELAPITPDDMKIIQMDDLDATARVFVPAIVTAWNLNKDKYTQLNDYIQLLSAWDYHLAPDSVAASIFQLWTTEMAEKVFIDNLPSGTGSYIFYEDRWIQLLKQYVLEEPMPSCIQPSTPEERNTVILEALNTAVETLVVKAGPDKSFWKWGDLNQAVFPHPSGVEAIVGAGKHRWGGGRFTVRVGHYSLISDLPFENDFGAVLRSVISSNNGEWNIEAVLPPGEGGIAFGPHGTDQIDLWLNGQMREVDFRNEREPSSRLELVCYLESEPIP